MGRIVRPYLPIHVFGKCDTEMCGCAILLKDGVSAPLKVWKSVMFWHVQIHNTLYCSSLWRKMVPSRLGLWVHITHSP